MGQSVVIPNFVVQKAIVRHVDGTYLVLRRSATDPHKPLEWDLPGGMQDEGEYLEVGVVREIAEETGMNVQRSAIIPRYIFCVTTEKNAQKVNYMQLIYAAQVSTKAVTMSYEHDLFEWVDVAEFTKRFASQPRYHKAIRYIIDNKLDVLA